MKNIKFCYESIRRRFEIGWKYVEVKFDIDVNIPNGVEAEIILPNGGKKEINEGKNHFECLLNKKLYSPFSVETPLFEILKNGQVVIL